MSDDVLHSFDEDEFKSKVGLVMTGRLQCCASCHEDSNMGYDLATYTVDGVYLPCML